jgi:hypothetical protein
MQGRENPQRCLISTLVLEAMLYPFTACTIPFAFNPASAAEK